MCVILLKFYNWNIKLLYRLEIDEINYLYLYLYNLQILPDNEKQGLVDDEFSWNPTDQ